MSDSELSAAPNAPTDAEIEQCLRRVVRELQKTDPDAITVNNVRKQAELELSLDPGFLKQGSQKARSKDIIEAVVNEDASEPESPEKPAMKPRAKPAMKAGKKRKSDDEEATKSQRRRKAAKVEPENVASASEIEQNGHEHESSFEEEKKPKKKVAKKTATRPMAKKKDAPKKKTAPKIESEDEGSDVAQALSKSAARVASEDDESEPVGDVKHDKNPLEETSELSDAPDKISAPETNGKPAVPEDDESEMSELIDEPPKKKRQKKAAEPKAKSKSKVTATSSKAKAKPAGKELSASEEEIKKLQGWLVKCGIRKLWHNELKSCSTDKEKIKHLKGMLDDVGMTGRMSNEKAKQIKESRELAAELEAVKEYEQRWGHSEDDGEEEKSHKGDDEEEEESKGGAPPKRRLPKGLVDFGDSGDEGSD